MVRRTRPQKFYRVKLRSEMTSNFTVTFSAYDRANHRPLFFKADGRRFSSERTVKIGCDVKYDVTVTVKPSVFPLQKLVIGGDDIVPDKVEQREDCAEYTFTWLTNGYTTTQKGRRHDLKFSFLFDNTELAVSFQVKFYPVQDSTHLTWGTKIQRIELEAKGQAGAVGFQTLSPTNVTFK